MKPLQSLWPSIVSANNLTRPLHSVAVASRHGTKRSMRTLTVLPATAERTGASFLEMPIQSGWWTYYYVHMYMCVYICIYMYMYMYMYIKHIETNASYI